MPLFSEDKEHEFRMLQQRVDRAEEDILRLQGSRIRQRASGSAGGGTGTGSGLTAAEVLALLQRALIFQETITTTGTSHSTTYAVALDVNGDPIIVAFLNGVAMRRGATGNNGWSYTNPSTITTVKSLVASDKLTVAYARRTV